jgi:aryl-alcohol dehydrogenase-like predicted oxidoreductase
MAIAWCLKNPHVSTVILGASRPEQLEETITSADVVPMLTDEVMKAIEEVVQNKPGLPQY